MGVEYYSFTIPWTRILPFALPGTPVNQQAIEHYNDVIDAVLEAGMQPVVTMLHFDSPLMFVASDNISMTPFLLIDAHSNYFTDLLYQRDTLTSDTTMPVIRTKLLSMPLSTMERFF